MVIIMAYEIIKELPSIKDLIKEFPLSNIDYQNINNHKREIQDILLGRDERLLIILGPCSAWPYDAVLEYAERLKKINNHISHKLKIVMRLYTHKQRTAKGWLGPANQPDISVPPDIESGLRYSRKLMVEVSKKNIAIADEAVFINNTRGFIDLLSWVAVGARSSENFEHRVFASGIDCPVGIKNPTSGSIKIGINGVITAQDQHTTIINNNEVKTFGNNFAHLVLRGGGGKPNYTLGHLKEALITLKMAKVINPAVIIDVSHDNCLVGGVKEYLRQGDIIFEIQGIINKNPELKALVKGFMLESFIKSGNQNVNSKYLDLNGLSITDPCLGWEETESLLLKLANME